MKANVLFVSLLLILSQALVAQNITLNDLERFCDSQNWESVNQALTRKGWVFHDSKRGDSEHYHVITWAHNRSYDDSAEAWFSLYTHDGASNKVSYSVFNQQGSDIIQNAIGLKGYNLKESHIEDGVVISIYQNNNYILETSLEKRENSGYYTTITGYTFTLIQKSGVYDPDNGKKVSYYYGDLKEMEYTLKDGELNGEFIIYYENGNIKKRGVFKQGKEDGQFFEYDERGIKTIEYQMSNGELSGLTRTFSNGKVYQEIYFQQGEKNGSYTEYFYGEDFGSNFLKYSGQYINGKENGKWQYHLIQDGDERLLGFTNYSNGIKNGPFQDFEGDSLILGNYQNDLLHGYYQIYLDFTRMMVIPDTANLVLIEEGAYQNGKKNGVWSYYDYTGALKERGRYENSLKIGEWSFYYPVITDEWGERLSFSGNLYKIETYRNDKRNGLCQRFSYIEKLPSFCIKEEDGREVIDSCWIYENVDVREVSYYKDDFLNGFFELRDSTDLIITSGNYKDGKKEGEWLQGFVLKDFFTNEIVNSNPNSARYYFQKGFYSDDKKVGEWVEFINEGNYSQTWNYRNGVLHGEHTFWNEYNKPKEIRTFLYGKLSSLIINDSLGLEPKRKYEILGDKCIKTEYYEEGYISQEYWIGGLKDTDPYLFDFFFTTSTRTNEPEEVVFPSGKLEIFDEDDRPLVIGVLEKDKRYGQWTFFFYDQNVRVENYYVENEIISEKYFTLAGQPFSGKFNYADEEEGTYQVIAVKNGVRHGNSDTYDQETGERISREKYREGELR